MIIQEKGNTRFKLTIAEKETRLKIKVGASPEDIARIKKFAEEIEAWVRPHFTITLRGYFRFWKDQWACDMHYGRQQLAILFSELPFKASPSTHWEDYLKSIQTEELENE